jgi:hypothetical protein
MSLSHDGVAFRQQLILLTLRLEHAHYGSTSALREIIIKACMLPYDLERMHFPKLFTGSTCIAG